MRRSRRSHELERTDRQMPAVAASIARSVRSGTPLSDAFEEAARSVAVPGSALAEDLRWIGNSVRRGRALDGALEEWSEKRQEGCVDLFVAACRFGHAHGGDVAAALEGAAVSLSDQAELADEARALASQARTSAGVLVALPVFGAAGFSLLDPQVARTLFSTGAGLLCLIVGVTLDAVGALVLSRMVRAALR